METFTEPRPLVDNPRFEIERRRALESFSLETIDPPIRGLIGDFARLRCCFTMQSCWGHFVHAAQTDPHNLAPLPPHDVGRVTYRIAYVALCIQNSDAGQHLLTALAEIPSIEPDCVHLGSPGWFWARHPNSYALQVEPARFAGHDQAVIEHAEALHVQETRDRFFAELGETIAKLADRCTTA